MTIARVQLAGLSALLLVGLGCSRERAVWVASYRPTASAEYPPSNAAAIRFDRVEYETLNRSEAPGGYFEIGRSGMRSPLLRERPDGPGSTLRAQAARVGADLVRWAEVPVGLAIKSGPRVSASAARGVAPQPPPPQAETHADYLAVFYRRSR